MSNAVFHDAVRGRAIPLQAYYRPWGFQEDEAPRLQDSRHKKVVRLSALLNGRLYHPRGTPGIHSYWRLCRPQGHSRPEELCERKIKITPSGIESATFRLVLQCLKQLRHHVPPWQSSQTSKRAVFILKSHKFSRYTRTFIFIYGYKQSTALAAPYCEDLSHGLSP